MQVKNGVGEKLFYVSWWLIKEKGYAEEEMDRSRKDRSEEVHLTRGFGQDFDDNEPNIDKILMMIQDLNERF